MAQVMYYHKEKSVSKTIKEIPGYTCKEDGKVEINVETIPKGSIIDWDNMENSYDGSETQTQKEAVANLMVYCGTAIKMGYGTGTSVAFNDNVPTALQEYFDYTKTMILESRSNYNDNEWEDLIYSELAKGNPIFYSGQDNNGYNGHAFVCDGYDGGGYYHINWGWGGLSDGNFRLSALTPAKQGVGGGNTSYNVDQLALIGAVPNISEEPFVPELQKCATPTINYSNGVISFSCSTEGVKFVSEVSADDAQRHSGSKVKLAKVYKISVYASKDGYSNSEVATREVIIDNSNSNAVLGDVDGNGVVNETDHLKLTEIIMQK